MNRSTLQTPSAVPVFCRSLSALSHSLSTRGKNEWDARLLLATNIFKHATVPDWDSAEMDQQHYLETLAVVAVAVAPSTHAAALDSGVSAAKDSWCSQTGSARFPQSPSLPNDPGTEFGTHQKSGSGHHSQTYPWVLWPTQVLLVASLPEYYLALRVTIRNSIYVMHILRVLLGYEDETILSSIFNNKQRIVRRIMYLEKTCRIARKCRGVGDGEHIVHTQTAIHADLFCMCDSLPIRSEASKANVRCPIRMLSSPSSFH